MRKIFTGRFTHIVLLLLLLSGIAGVRMMDANWIKSLRNIAFDAYNTAHPRPQTDQVVVLDIDEESLLRYGQFPWPRNYLASLVKKLSDQGAAVIAFDMVFAEEDKSSPKWVVEHLPDDPRYKDAMDFFNRLRDYDELFAEAIADSGTVVTGFVWSPDKTATRRKPALVQPVGLSKNAASLKDSVLKIQGAVTNIPILTRHAAGNGMFGVVPDVDGIIRQVPLLFRYEDAKGDITLYPSLAMETLRVYHDPKSVIKVRRLKEEETGSLSPPFAMKIGNYEIPLDETAQFYGYFSKQRRENYIPVWKVLDDKINPSDIKDKIIIIGTSAEGLRDIRSTPLDLYIPGVELHVNVIEQVLTGKYLIRPSFIDGMEMVATLALSLLIILLAPFISAVWLFLMTGGLVGAIAYGSYLGFLHHGLLIDPVFPSLSIILIFVVSTILSYIRTEAERQQIRGAFGLYVSKDFLAELTKNPEKLKLGGEVRDLTVMFTDIRSFTTISESLSPEELIQLMNDFLTPMSDLVMTNRGTIDKYMGDAMMAFWNAPLDDPDHARHACLTALKMNDALTPINDRLKERARETGRTPTLLSAGIGINTGPCSVGNMGSRQRFAYSALGDAVNLASRLEGQTKSYGVRILIGEETAKAISGMALMELDLLQVKGKTRPVRIYTLLGDEQAAQEEGFKRWIAAHNAMLAAYRAADFACAAQDCADARSAANGAMEDYYAMYALRIADLTKNPPADDWDGVFVATSK